MSENEPQSPQEPVGQPPHVESPTEGEHLESPEPGHPAGETEPPGGVPKRAHEHPEDIDETTPDKQSSP
jgi:hypothetical protein